jgi:uncharacterized LabA/DUF88 family protein
MRTIVFIDGQNLFHLARAAWATATGLMRYNWPSYDAKKVAERLVARAPGRTLTEIRFCTGVPDSTSLPTKNKLWHAFWTNKLRAMTNQGIIIYKGRVNRGGQEKGVDVRLALDVVHLTHESRYDCGIIVSEDWDFGSAVSLAKIIARHQSRVLSFESAFPFDNNNTSPRGIPGTTWVHIDKPLYDSCHDPKDYR